MLGIKVGMVNYGEVSEKRLCVAQLFDIIYLQDTNHSSITHLEDGSRFTDAIGDGIIRRVARAALR